MRPALVWDSDRAVEVFALRLMMHVVEATDSDRMRVPPVINHVQVVDWMRERSSSAFGLWSHGGTKVFDGHPGLLRQVHFVLEGTPRNLEIRLRLLLVVDVDDAW